MMCRGLGGGRREVGGGGREVYVNRSWILYDACRMPVTGC